MTPRNKAVVYPFEPLSARSLEPGQYWSVPLADGRFGCGLVLASDIQTKGGKRFMCALLDWHSAKQPSAKSISGAKLKQLGRAHIRTIKWTGGKVLGSVSLSDIHLTRSQRKILKESTDQSGHLITTEHTGGWGPKFIEALANHLFVDEKLKGKLGSRARELDCELAMRSTKFPFVPETVLDLQPGEFFAVPLPDGSFACGLVFSHIISYSGTIFVCALLDWHKKTKPTAKSIEGSSVLDLGVTGIKTVTMAGGEILGVVHISKITLSKKLWKLVDATTEFSGVINDYDGWNEWGYEVPQMLAEQHFLAPKTKKTRK